MRDLTSGLRLALGTLTVVPVGQVDTSRRSAGAAMLLAPLAGLPVAAGVGAATWAGHRVQLTPTAVGLLVVAVSALLTRGMHLDGLADVTDGLGSGWDRARALAVMKRSDVGPMGLVCVVVVLGLQAASVSALVDHPWLVMTTWLVGRSACTVLASGPASVSDSGLGALVTRTVAPLPAVAVAAASCALLVLVATADGLAPLGAAAAVLVATAVDVLLVRRCIRRFGGINGDVFGAAVELAVTAIVVVLSAGVWR